MRPRRHLLITWENGSARDTHARVLGRVAADDARETLRCGFADTPEVNPLDALRDAAELVSLLSGWQWQAMHAARVNGASWAEVGAAIGVDADAARGRASRRRSAGQEALLPERLDCSDIVWGRAGRE